MKRILIVCVLLALLTVIATAQRGGQGGRRGFGAAGGPAILIRADVSKELKLTDSQITKFESLLESMRPQGRGGRDGGGGGGRGGGGGGRGGFGRGGDPEQAAATDKKLKDILNDSQYKRFHELSLQQAGGFALNQPKVAEQLELTSSQKSKLEDLNLDMREEMQDMFSGGGGGGDRESMMAEMRLMRTEYGKKMLKLLNADQKKKWAEMTGKPFKFAADDR